MVWRDKCILPKEMTQCIVNGNSQTIGEVFYLLVYLEYAILSHGSHSFREELSLSLLMGLWSLCVYNVSFMCLSFLISKLVFYKM